MAKSIYKRCPDCKKDKQTLSGFYSSNSPMFPDGRSAICKACILNMLDVTDLVSVKKVLRLIDRPYIFHEWQKALNSGTEPFGTYLRNIGGLPVYKDLTYDDSVEGEIEVITYKQSNDMIVEEDIYEKPSMEVVRKWGTEYSNKEYYELEKLWHEMITSNEISTPQHRKQLNLYCKLAIRVDRALESNTKDFELLNKQFLAVQTASGFRPIDRVSGSESAGVRNFSTIFEEVERDGFIEPFDTASRSDLVDKSIVSILNYQRKLLGMGQMQELPSELVDEIYGDMEDEDGDL